MVVALQHVQARRGGSTSETDGDALRTLVAGADVLLVGGPPGAARRLDWASLSAADPRLIVVSITPFGPGQRAPPSR